MDQLLDLDNQLCFRLYSISRKMTEAYTPLLKKFDLTYPQYVVMLALFKDPVIDFKELSEEVNLKTGTLTPLITNLVRTGYVKKEKNQDDLRKINIILTDKGRLLKSSIREVPVSILDKLKISYDLYQSLVSELDALDALLNKKEEM